MNSPLIESNFGFNRHHDYGYALSKTFEHYGVWKVHQVKIEARFEGIHVSIRGEDTCWLNANNCYFGPKDEMEDMLGILNHQKKIASLSFQHIVNGNQTEYYV